MCVLKAFVYVFVWQVTSVLGHVQGTGSEVPIHTHLSYVR